MEGTSSHVRQSQAGLGAAVLVALVVLSLTFDECSSKSLTSSTPLSASSVYYTDVEEYNWHKIELNGQLGEGYYITLLIGSEKQEINVLIDTGSSNLAVTVLPNDDTSRYFEKNKSQSFEDKQKTVEVTYTQGSWKGKLGFEQMLIKDSGILNDIGAYVVGITESDNFFINGSKWEGILGLAYSDLAQPDSSVKPFFDSLVENTGIKDVFTILLCGSTSDNVTLSDYDTGGIMTIGAIDGNQYSGDIMYTPLVKQSYYQVEVTDIQVAGKSLDIDCKEYNYPKSIVDSGTTNLRVPDLVWDQIAKEFKNKSQIKLDDKVLEGKLLKCWRIDVIPPWHSFPNLTLSLASVGRNKSFNIHISPQQYLKRVKHNDNKPHICYKFSISKSSSGTVLGSVVMENLLTVFDRQNRNIGFAEGICQGKNEILLGGRKLLNTLNNNGSNIQCIKNIQEDKNIILLTTVIVLACAIGLCIIIQIWLVIYKTIKKRRKESSTLHQYFPEDDTSNNNHYDNDKKHLLKV